MDRGKAMAMDTQEFRLAILHTVIAESKPGTGKTHLQKLCYFLQTIFDVPTKYSFRMHHYGPYAEALETDMAKLRITGYIDIKPDSQGVVENHVDRRLSGGVGPIHRTLQATGRQGNRSLRQSSDL